MIKIHRVALLAHLLGFLLLLSIVSSYPQFKALLAGRCEELTLSGHWGLRILREITILIIYLLFFDKLLRSIVNPRFLLIILIILFISILSFVLTVIKLKTLIVPLIGLRIFEYLPLILIIYKLRQPEKFVNIFSIYIYIFIIIETLFSIFELFEAPPVVGKTIFGTRIFGTFSNPNILGLTTATCALFLELFNKTNFFFFLSLIISVLSGSRTAILMSFIIFSFFYIKKINKKWEFPFIFAMLISIPFIFEVASLKYFSGRYIHSIKRLTVWGEILKSNINNIPNLLFGWGLGLGDNTLTTVFGPSKFHGQFIADSSYIYIISAFGLLGLLTYLGIIIINIFPLKYNKFLIIIFITLISIPTIWFENFPANLIITLILGGYITYKNNLKPKNERY